jgi:hypothetical protein
MPGVELDDTSFDDRPKPVLENVFNKFLSTNEK